MDKTSSATVLLPTTSAEVETWLRSFAPHELLKFREAGLSEYPYLFGMATMKLAEAHSEYVRLIKHAVVGQSALGVLDDVRDFLDDQSDVNDGDDGQPVANRAMRLLQDVEAVITKAGR